MPTERKKSLCMDAMRHAEYYGMQQTFDELYAQSKAGNVFPNLMEKILSSDNIMLAYRNIKTNTGSYTAGTDKQNMESEKLLQAANTAIAPNQCDERRFPSLMVKQDHWESRASGTG